MVSTLRLMNIGTFCTSSKATAEYYAVSSDGYITEKKGVKENKINYNGDKTGRRRRCGTFSVYTYNTEADGERCKICVEFYGKVE